MSDGRSYPAQPLIGVGAVVWHRGRVLLARRARPPRVGQWSIPGGLLEPGETVEAAIRREVLEETGVTIGAVHHVDTVDLVERDAAGAVRTHYVLIDGTALALDERLRPDPEEVLEAAWHEPAGLASLQLWSETLRVIAAAQRVLGEHGNEPGR
jgi:ADP-ribose pyrophosphatase YjhB (NUDIX family)